MHCCWCRGDSLPSPSGTLVAAEVELRRLTSLLDLTATAPPPPSAAAAKLVAVGDVDYLVRPPTPGSPPGADRAGHIPPSGRPRFAPLHGSRREVHDVEASFVKAFPGAPSVVLRGDGATQAALTAKLPGATFVHFATHGFFADDQVRARTASVGGGKLATQAFDLAPFALSGLALTGANLPPDANGLSPGLLTAAEMQRLDFSACYLAVVSACESAVGAWSKGQGLASLQQSLHVAGARYVVSTLWPVNDAAAHQFMKSFYDALWQQPDQPYRALRTAKLEAQRAGLPFPDWAAFQLTGN